MKERIYNYLQAELPDSVKELYSIAMITYLAALPDFNRDLGEKRQIAIEKLILASEYSNNVLNKPKKTFDSEDTFHFDQLHPGAIIKEYIDGLEPRTAWWYISSVSPNKISCFEIEANNVARMVKFDPRSIMYRRLNKKKIQPFTVNNQESGILLDVFLESMPIYPDPLNRKKQRFTRKIEIIDFGTPSKDRQENPLTSLTTVRGTA